MNRSQRLASILALLLLGQLLLPSVALAYLDPGTGSFILQMVIGAILGGLVAIGVFWRRVLAFLKRIFSGKSGQDGTPEGK